MDYESVYRRYAEGIKILGGFYYSNADTLMPIGIDGAVISHLMAYNLSMVNGFLDNLISASSKTGEVDEERLGLVFRQIDSNECVMGVDLRNKTGKLHSLLTEKITKKNYHGNFLYSTIFDQRGSSDLRAFNKPIEDEKVLRWTDSGTYSKLIYKDSNGRWVYNIDDDKIAKFDHVKEIKKLL